MKSLIAAAFIAFGFCAGGSALAENPAINSEEQVVSDFDFLMGKWTITHKRLNNPLQPDPDWSTFDTKHEAWALMGGLANVDKTYGELNGEYFEGVSVRTYNKGKNEWTIYWMDTWNSTLREQVRGSFKDGVGTFYGEEKHKGVTYPMRFLWKSVDENNARWEQAYKNPENDEWETNWIMEFFRVE